MTREITPDTIRLDGRVGVVTGAAQGIGRATAVALAGFGMDVAICDRNDDGLGAVEHEIAEIGRGVVASSIDVRDLDAVGAFAAVVRERWGHVDALVNNAGGTFMADFMSVAPKGDRALVDENFISVVNVTRAFVPLMEGRAGSVVNVTSSEAFQAAPGFAVYAAMKTAQESLTKTLALELGLQGIRVNSVSPDGIPTAGDEALAAATQERSPFTAPPLPPIGFFAEAADCAAVIVFLVSDLARFVTGCAVHVDGGIHAAGGWHRTSAGDRVPESAA
jgi:NAD(P)-dependent dehydrogenase (short-subunit alcohol dehydrogenase family)